MQAWLDKKTRWCVLKRRANLIDLGPVHTESAPTYNQPGREQAFSRRVAG